MPHRDKALRLLALALWASVMLTAQWAVHRRQKGERQDLFRDYQAQGRLTPAMRQAYRSVARGSEAAYVFTQSAMTVAGCVTGAVIPFVPLRRKDAAGPGELAM